MGQRDALKPVLEYVRERSGSGRPVVSVGEIASALSMGTSEVSVAILALAHQRKVRILPKTGNGDERSSDVRLRWWPGGDLGAGLSAEC